MRRVDTIGERGSVNQPCHSLIESESVEYLPAISIAAFFVLLMAWSNDQDKKQYPNYSLRDDFVTLLRGIREMTLKDAIIIVWKLGVYVICLIAFFWVAGMIGITGPLCWRC